MTMQLLPRYGKRLQRYEENTRLQQRDTAEQLQEVAKIVGQAELLANRLRDAADTFIYRDRGADDHRGSPEAPTASTD